MPHLGDKRKKESGTESQDDESDEEEPGEDSDDEYSDKRDWLESMGLDKEQFPLLNPKTITPDQINNLRTIDQQPTSTVLVKGADTHALFNFLLNCKSLIANTGPLAQVPPTLLAPVAFDGAALKGLRVNQGILKHQQAKGMTQVNNRSSDLFVSSLHFSVTSYSVKIMRIKDLINWVKMSEIPCIKKLFHLSMSNQLVNKGELIRCTCIEVIVITHDTMNYILVHPGTDVFLWSLLTMQEK